MALYLLNRLVQWQEPHLHSVCVIEPTHRSTLHALSIIFDTSLYMSILVSKDVRPLRCEFTLFVYERGNDLNKCPDPVKGRAAL
jgi:hypothetical protein